MNSRWFNAAVVLLWLATMTWLVREKVLPPLREGDPPNYSQIIKAQRDEPPVGWKVIFGGSPLGWALTDFEPQAQDVTEIHGRVCFDSLPLDAMMPPLLKPFSRLVAQPKHPLQLDARNELVIDPLGHLIRFDSTVRIDPINQVVSMRGEIEGRQLDLTLRSGNLSFNQTVPLPPNALLSDALSPQTQLPDLCLNKKWTVPVFTPLWPGKNMIEIVRAQVEGVEPILWAGKMERTWLVVYRSDTGVGSAESQAVKGKVWVRSDGAVLQQQMMLFDSSITFIRMSKKESEQLVSQLGPKWWTVESIVPFTPPKDADPTESNHD